MAKEREHEDGVRVVDRRRLDEEGEERGEEATGDREPAAPRTTSPEPPTAGPQPPPRAEAAAGGPAAASVGDDGDSEEWPAAPFPIDFTAFVQSLAQQALMHMGILPHPESGERVRELSLARQTVDILQMLHEKTQGNLTPDEKRLFDALLHDLRLAFVQLSQ